MLVLTRKKSEMIQIGENIVVKVIRTGKGHVKLGIEAPADVRVLRAELCDEACELENAEAELESEEKTQLTLSVA
ncbi:MAG: carbon storage regulator [Planctomyces sp.]|nr:carbon storage regulator [Planctomyces sp.]